jgi:hypothetical protein
LVKAAKKGSVTAAIAILDRGFGEAARARFLPRLVRRERYPGKAPPASTGAVVSLDDTEGP